MRAIPQAAKRERRLPMDLLKDLASIPFRSGQNPSDANLLIVRMDPGILSKFSRISIAAPKETGKMRAALIECRTQWRGAGAAERDGLENRCGGNPTEGSNPSLSAKLIRNKKGSSNEEPFCLEAGVGIEPASTALQAAA